LSPIPSWRAVNQLIRAQLSRSIALSTKLQLASHIASLVLYFPIHLLVLPIDFCVACFVRSFSQPSPPVFICGTPRSGSTLLHRLLINSSPDLFGITHYEWRYPSIIIQLISAALGVKQRLSTKDYWQKSPVRQEIARMHPNTLGDYEEDAILFEERVGLHPYQFLHAPIASLNKQFTFSSLPQSRSFFSLRKRLLRLYELTIHNLYPLKIPSRIFVSKEVASNDRLEDMYKKWSKSKFIIITRSPSDYLSSLRPLLELSTLSKTSSRSHTQDPSWWNSWYTWLVKQASFVTAFFVNHINEQPSRVLHVRFEDLMETPRDQLERIHSFLNLQLTSTFDSTVTDFEASQSSRIRGYEYGHMEEGLDDFALFLEAFYPK
jgi:omega-hydroxy-beta-dihydromenaquinone-9 sulfotransferase